MIGVMVNCFNLCLFQLYISEFKKKTNGKSRNDISTAVCLTSSNK